MCGLLKQLRPNSPNCNLFSKKPKYQSTTVHLCQNQDKLIVYCDYRKPLSLSLPLGYCDSGLLLQTSVYICFSFMWRILIPNSSFTDLSLPSYAEKGKAATTKRSINEEKCRADLQSTTELTLSTLSLVVGQHLLVMTTTPTCSCKGLGACRQFDWCVCVLLSSGWPRYKTLLVVKRRRAVLRAQIIRTTRGPGIQESHYPVWQLTNKSANMSFHRP